MLLDAGDASRECLHEDKRKKRSATLGLHLHDGAAMQPQNLDGPWVLCMQTHPALCLRLQIDLDTIETSNLNRQFLFRRRHVGESKARTAAAVIQ
jgi:hypothetical protein